MEKETKKSIVKAGDSKAVVASEKKEVKKTAIKEKKAGKPKSDAGANLTKAPGRIILTPRITEKAVRATINSTYVFEVAMDATKRDVVAAIKALYGITPLKVNVVRKGPRAYVARFRNRRGTKAGVKKALVFLKKGEKIDIA